MLNKGRQPPLLTSSSSSSSLSAAAAAVVVAAAEAAQTVAGQRQCLAAWLSFVHVSVFDYRIS